MAVTIKDLRFSIYLNNADAKKSAIDFQNQLQQVGAEMANLSAQGKKDTPEYKEKKKAFDELKISMEQNKLQAGLLGMSWNELSKLSKSMKADMNKLVPDSAEWKRLDTDLKVVNGRMSEMKGTAKTTQDSLNKMGGAGSLGALPGIFGTIQTKAIAAYAAISGKSMEAIGMTKSLSSSLVEMRAFRKFATVAEEEARVAELALKNAVAEGTATDVLAANAERARAVATEASTVATTMGSAAMKVFKIALASTGIGILLVALGALVMYFESTNEGAKKLKQITAGLSAYFQDFLKIGGQIGKILFDSFTTPGGAITALTGFIKQAILPLKTIFILFGDIKKGDFGAAFTHVKDAMKEGWTNMGNIVTGTVNTVVNGVSAIGKSAGVISTVSLKAMQDHSKMATQIEIDKQKLQKQEREWSGEQIRLNGEIDVLEKKASRTSALSMADKAAAAKKAKQMRIDMFNTDLKYAKENERIVNAEQGFNSKKDYQAIQDAKNRTAQLIADKNNRIQGLQNKEDKANKGAGTETESAEKKKLNAELKALENENLTEIDKIKKQYADGYIKNEYDYNKKMLDQEDIYDAKLKAKITDLLDVKKKGHVTDLGLRLELQKKVAEIDKKTLDAHIEQNKKIQKILLDADPIAQENEAYENRLRELGLFGKKKEDMTAEQLDALRMVEDQHNETMRKLSTKEAIVKLSQLEKDKEKAETALSKRRETEKMSDQAYKDELLALELEFLKKKLAINGLSADEIDKITKQLTQKQIDETTKNLAEEKSWLEKNGIGELARLKNQKEIELALIDRYEKKKLITQKQAIALRKITNAKEFAQNLQATEVYFKAYSEIAGNISGTLQNLQSAESKSIELKYQKQIDAATKAGKDTTKLEEQKNKEMAALRAKNADAMFALQVSQIIASTAVAAIEAYASALKIPVIGLTLAPIAAGAAVLYGASQVAVANAERKNAKAGYYDGGFTGGTDPKQVRGYLTNGEPVHGEEFVANHKAVRNPSVRKFLDVFNAAQLDGSIHLLNTPQILEKVRATGGISVGSTGNGKYSGGYSSGASLLGDNPLAMAMLSKVSDSIDRLNTQLDNGIQAHSVISGDYGSVKQTERYLKMKSNATRG